jgi:hypothetical protein
MEEVKVTQSASVPPGSTRKMTLTVTRSRIRVRFTYKEKLLYSNGELVIRDGSGVYENVDAWTSHTVIVG